MLDHGLPLVVEVVIWLAFVAAASFFLGYLKGRQAGIRVGLQYVERLDAAGEDMDERRRKETP